MVIEELDGVTSKAVERYLKVQLEEKNLTPRTSNDATGLPAALMERFRLLRYSSGPLFAEACREHIMDQWAELTGDHHSSEYCI